MKPAHILAVIIIVVCMVVSLIALGGAMAPHVTIPQAKERIGQIVQVPGAIDQGSVGYNGAKGELRFDILGINRKGTLLKPEQRLTVVYRQAKPENFDTATSVEAVGRYENGVFRADRLLIKCPSKYGDEQKSDQTAGVTLDWRLIATVAGAATLIGATLFVFSGCRPRHAAPSGE